MKLRIIQLLSDATLMSHECEGDDWEENEGDGKLLRVDVLGEKGRTIAQFACVVAVYPVGGATLTVTKQ